MKALSRRHLEYVRRRATGKSARESARLAGYSRGYSKNAAEKLDRHPLIAAELAKMRREIAAMTKFDAQEAMAELDRTIAFAEKTENATAMARCVELKMKLNGLLVERVDQRQVASFAINISGIDEPPALAPPTIDVTPEVDPFS